MRRQLRHGPSLNYVGYCDLLSASDPAELLYRSLLKSDPHALAPCCAPCHLLDVRSRASGRSIAVAIFAIATIVSARASAESEPRGGVADHVANTEIAIEVRAGEWVAAGTCGLPGARNDFDTTLRMRGPDGSEIAYSDDACGGLGSRLSFRATQTGTHHLVLGCYSGGSCGGRVAWRIDDEEVSMPEAEWQAGVQARALLGPDGQGLVADAWIAVRIDALGGLTLRLDGAPMGIAGGLGGGLLAGAVQLTAGFDAGFVSFGIGGGVTTLSRRSEGIEQREAATLALRMRFGAPNHFNAGAALLLAFPGEDEPDFNLDFDAMLPIESVEIVARAIYGMSGVWLGEVGVVWWAEGVSRRGVGLALLAGGSAVSYQPVCRFGLVCQSTTYAGPHVGLGVHIRP